MVTTSRYSYLFGSVFHHLVPVALAGLVWSVAMLALCSPWAWRAASPWVARARLAGSVAGVATVLWLLWAELIKLRHICEYCTVVHILTFALFVVLILGTALAVPAEPEPPGGLDVPPSATAGLRAAPRGAGLLSGPGARTSASHGSSRTSPPRSLPGRPPWAPAR